MKTDHRHPVPDAIMQIAGDPQPLLSDPACRLGLPSLLRPFGTVQGCAQQFAAGSGGVADRGGSERDQRQNIHTRVGELPDGDDVHDPERGGDRAGGDHSATARRRGRHGVGVHGDADRDDERGRIGEDRQHGQNRHRDERGQRPSPARDDRDTDPDREPGHHREARVKAPPAGFGGPAHHGRERGHQQRCEGDRIAKQRPRIPGFRSPPPGGHTVVSPVHPPSVRHPVGLRQRRAE